jgi:hypothetical protein
MREDKPRPNGFSNVIGLAGLRIDIQRARHFGMNATMDGTRINGELMKSAGPESDRAVTSVDHR